MSLLSFLLRTATIPSQSSTSSLSSSEDDDHDDETRAVSSLESRVGVGARSAALREISVYKASDDDRWVARGQWSLPPSTSLPSYGNLSHSGWMSADEPSKSKTDNADWRLHGHEKHRTHEGHRKTRRHGNRRWTAAGRRRTGRHIKQKPSFNDVWDYEVDEPEIPSSCGELQCSGSARCVVDQRNGHARCRCPIGTTGIHCEQGQYFNAN